MQSPLGLCAVLALSACSSNPAATDGGVDFAAIRDLALPAPGLAQAPPDLAEKTVYTVFIRGKLKNDPATSKMIHDNFAGNGKAQAIGLGDQGHYVFLNLLPPPDGGALPPSDQVLAIDLWNDLNGLQTFLQNPDVQSFLGSLYTGQPEVTITIHPDGFTEWGALNPINQAKPLFAFSIRDTFKASSVDQEKTDHNSVADNAKASAMGAGDVAHTVYLDMTDTRQFQAIDYWTNLTGPGQVYGDPNFQAAFASIFTMAPTVEGYVASDWVQW